MPEQVSQTATRISFLGITLGEFLKVARLFWLLLGMMVVGFLGALLLQGSAPI